MALLFNRKNKEDKKGKETNIGKAIYILLLFAPIFAVAVACGYVVFNKNAYQSYTNYTIDKLQKVNNNDQNIEGYTYYLQYNDETTTNYSATIRYKSTNINWTEFIGTEINYNVVAFQTYPNLSYIRLYDENLNSTNYSLSNRDKNYLNQKYIVYESGQLYTTSQALTFYMALQTEGKLDNVFYYQLNKLEESDLFNWSKNTGTYTVVHNTTTLLGITNTYTPMLLTYWLIISVVYFIYDIALILIWAVHKKIHLLMESI